MNISDRKLYELCKKYGQQTRLWRQKFSGLLPEVYKRKLYQKKGFSSIFEFAAKLAGLSQEQVRLVLNLEKSFADKPTLQKMLVQGEVSVNKLARVASIATPENQQRLAEQVQILSKSALETLVRDTKTYQENSEYKPLLPTESLPGQKSDLQLSDKIKQKLLALQEKGLDVNELLREFLEKRELEIALEKEQISEQQSANSAQKPSSYISVQTRAVIKKEHGTKCSIQTCQKPSKVIHHTQRFALSRNHHPQFLAPLCKDHHLIAHAIDVRFQRKRSLAISRLTLETAL